MTSNLKQPRNLLPSRAYAADLLLGEGFRGFFITQMTDEEIKEKRRAYAAKYYAKNKEKIKAASAKWHAENPEKAKKHSASYYSKNRRVRISKMEEWRKNNLEKAKETAANYYIENKDKCREKKKRWNQENPEKVKAQAARWYEKYKGRPRTEATKLRKQAWKKQRKAEDPIFAMAERLRNRLHIAFKMSGFKKNSRTEKMLGCTFKQFSKHIESQFTDGMSWDNRADWHLDHIVPLSCATTIEGLEKLSHYKNIRPLWAAENLSKSNNLVLI